MQPSERAHAQRLEQALDAVHAGLMAGRLGDLAGQVAEIEALLPLIMGLTDAPVARRLKAKAKRNEVCIAASARGVRAARQRLAEVLAAKTGFATYDGKGRRAPIAGAAGQLTQRF